MVKSYAIFNINKNENIASNIVSILLLINPLALPCAWRHSLVRHDVCLEVLPCGAQHVPPGIHEY